MRYEVRETYGGNFHQVIDNYDDRTIVQTFYTEQAAKEFCDRLNMENYFDHKVYGDVAQKI